MYSKSFCRNNTSFYTKCILGALFGSLFTDYQQKKFRNKACGLIGVLSNENRAEKYCLKGLEVMSLAEWACLATLDLNSNVCFSKYEPIDEEIKEDCIDYLKKTANEKHAGSKFGLLRTYWKGCGETIKKDASTLYADEENRLILGYIGEIFNYENMKDELISKYHVSLQTESCSEILMQFIGIYMKSKTQMSLLEATKKTLEKVEGSWGIIVYDRENPASMIVSRKERNFLLGLDDQTVYVASEVKSLNGQCSEIYQIKNQEVIEITFETISKMNDEMLRKTLLYSPLISPKTPFKHAIEQEIHEQDEAVYKCLGYGWRLSQNYEEQEDACRIDELKPHMNHIRKIKNLAILGKGSSYFSALYAVKFFKFLETFETVQALNLEDFDIYDLPLENAGVIIIVDNAESYSLHETIKKIKEKEIFVIGVVNKISNCLKNCFDAIVPINYGESGAVINIKSFLCGFIMLQLLNIWFSNHLNPNKKKMLRLDYKDSLRNLPLYLNECLSSQIEKIKLIAKTLFQEKSLQIVGKGCSFGVARETALKFMQITQIHTEAIYAGEMKHAHLALVDPINDKTTKTIFFIFEGESVSSMELTLSEVKLRGSYTIVISDCLYSLNSDFIDESIEIPKLEPFSSLLAVMPLQMLAYEIALIKNINPDSLPFSYK